MTESAQAGIRPADRADLIAVIVTLVAEDPMIAALRDRSLGFLQGEWAPLAAAWSPVELFGVFPGDLTTARRRLDCLGLIPALTLGMDGHIVEVTAARAVIFRPQTGSRLVHQRVLSSESIACVWWQGLL